MSYRLWTKDYKRFELRSATAATIAIEGAKLAARALLGDLVDYEADQVKLVSRTQHPILAGLIELNSKVKYGFTGRNHPIYLFTPFNTAYPPFVVGCSEKETSKNRLALVQFDHWSETFPRGNLIRLLAPDADEEALFWTYTPLACTTYRGPSPAASKLDERPLITAFHIDPPGCRDVDDVLTIYETPSGTRVVITIADVASVIAEGSPLDERAASIGQTFYQDGNLPKHMLPPELSEDQLSLRPSNTLKPGLSLDFALTDPSDRKWYHSAVQTTRTFTYESVYEDLSICDTLIAMTTALGEPTADSHKWIEAAMKFYNIAAAALLHQHGQGLLRSHEAPDQAKLTAYTAVCPDLKFLAYRSAVYVPATAAVTRHWGLDTELYTHITSPIRRYADLVNQRALKAILDNTPAPAVAAVADQLNAVAKKAKQHDRDLTLLRALKANESGQTVAQVLEIRPLPDGQTKLILYNEEWQLLLRLRYRQAEDGTLISKDEKTSHRVQVGTKVTLNYYADMRARSWKTRMVLSLA
jgi:exoribonuclease R